MQEGSEEGREGGKVGGWVGGWDIKGGRERDGVGVGFLSFFLMVSCLCVGVCVLAPSAASVAFLDLPLVVGCGARARALHRLLRSGERNMDGFGVALRATAALSRVAL